MLSDCCAGHRAVPGGWGGGGGGVGVEALHSLRVVSELLLSIL